MFDLLTERFGQIVTCSTLRFGVAAMMMFSHLASSALAAPPEATTRPQNPARAPSGRVAIHSLDAIDSLDDLRYLINLKEPFAVSIATADGRAGYVEGERFTVKVTAEEPCYITVVNWGPDGSATLLVPSPQITGNTAPYALANDATLILPKAPSAFRAQPPHGETAIVVFATKEPLTLDLTPPASADPKGEITREERLRKLFGGKRAGTKDLAVDEGPANPLAGTNWASATLLLMTGSDAKDLATRMGVREEEALQPAKPGLARDLWDELAIPDASESTTPVERPARKNPNPPLAVAEGAAASEAYRQRWERVLQGQGATKSIGTRFVPARPKATSMPRVTTIADELLVVRRPPAGSKAIGDTTTGTRGYRTERVPLVLPGSKSLARDEAALRQRIAELRAKDPTIVTIVPNHEVRIFSRGLQSSEDPQAQMFRGLQWHLLNEAASGHDIGWFLKASDLIEIDPVTIGVVDQGIHLNDARLRPFVLENPGEVRGNGTDDDGNGLIDDVDGWNFASQSAELATADDAFNHGSYCTSIMVGGPNRSPGHFFPIAYDPRVVVAACVAWDKEANTARGSVDTTFQAIEYAIQRGAKVINLSLGGPAGELELLLQRQHPVFELVTKRDVLLVIAAGNENTDIDLQPVSPACIDHPNTIVVMATDPDGHPARAWNAETKRWEQYSNWGRNHVDIAAPGTMILGIPSVDVTSYGDGTSYATPIVAATAAALWGAHPTWDAATVKRAILESARQVEGLEEQCVTGGMLDVRAALEWTP